MPDEADSQDRRRGFLRTLAGGTLAPLLPGLAMAQQAAEANRVRLPIIQAPTDVAEETPDPADEPSKRSGFAIVGLGHLSLSRILPAMAKTRHCKVVALVSGDPDKAGKIARQHGVDPTAIYNYDTFDRLADNPAVDVVYIVLPNGLHAEYTVRAARAGKHVLCEKPMANSVAECRQMIDACHAADRQLMIAYRSHYESHMQQLQGMVNANQLGTLKEFITTNSQNMGDPGQWRLKKALAGGGPLPDVGVYCMNGVRFVTGEEPVEAWGEVVRNTADERFREVEESVNFVLRFPSGLRATCHASYAIHKSQTLRLMGSEGWAEVDPAYAYDGQKLRWSKLSEGKEMVYQPGIAEVDQFAKEMDYMVDCMRNKRRPYSTGEDGLQDQRITEAIYESARTGRWTKIEQPAGAVRGPQPPMSKP